MTDEDGQQSLRRCHPAVLYPMSATTRLFMEMSGIGTWAIAPS
jgi:hypothetical protein